MTNTKSKYFITENRNGVSVRLKKNNRMIKRVLIVIPDDFVPDDPEVPDDYWAELEDNYPITIEDCYKEARRFIAELDRVDSFRSLPKVKLPRYLDELAHRESSEE